MKPISNLVAVLLVSMLSSCESDKIDPDKDTPCGGSSDLIITSTKICGWFPNYDSMMIDQTKLVYYNHCMKNATAKEYAITCDEWNLLVKKLDVSEFMKLDNHTCNVCADGCDVSFAIKTSDTYHRITFWPDQNQTPLVIKEFADEIEKLRTEFQGKTCN